MKLLKIVTGIYISLCLGYIAYINLDLSSHYSASPTLCAEISGIAG